jgi:hypothetical protein
MQVTLTLPKEQIHRWSRVWNHHQFKDWYDAACWLQNIYHAKAFAPTGSANFWNGPPYPDLLFVFETQEEQTAFVLAWLSD